MRILLLIAVFFCSASHADSNSRMLDMFGYFTLSNVAVKKCIKPDKEMYAAFVDNYKTVMVYAIKELNQKNPQLSPKKTNSILKKSGAKATKAVNEVLRKGGCENSKIQELIASFYAQAQWQPNANTVASNP